MQLVADRPQPDPCDDLAPAERPVCRLVRAAYAQVLGEPIPARLQNQIARLRAAETASKSGT